MTDAQKWLDKNYPIKKRNEIKKIDSGEVPLEGKLSLKGYPNLEIVKLSGSKGITKITIEDCPKIYSIDVNDNQISEIKGLEELKDLQLL